MSVFVVLLAAVSAPSVESRVGDWTVQCVTGTAADDGLYDHCDMRKASSGLRISGVEFIAVRNSAGIVVTVRFKPCSNLANSPSATIPAALLSGPDADKKFIGAQFLAMNILAQQCQKARGIALSLGGPEIPELLSATSKIRPGAPK